MMPVRLLVLGVSFVVTTAYLSYASRPEQIPPRSSLVGFPVQIGEWTGKAAPDFDRGVLEVLGVDEYVNRYYIAGDQLAHLYIGYYRSQRQGSSIHSPMNCLPGAGWAAVERGRRTLPTAGRQAEVNRVVIQKGLDRQLVLYWYQSHGRTVASEYWSKIYLVLDAIRLHRSDAALVRIIVPIDGARPNAEALAERSAINLAATIFPSFDEFLPS